MVLLPCLVGATPNPPTAGRLAPGGAGGWWWGAEHM